MRLRHLGYACINLTLGTKSRTLRLVREWAEEYRDELLDDWERARQGQPLNPIPPLA